MYNDFTADQNVVFSREKQHVAMKIHRCCECGEDILPRTKYVYFSGKYDYEFATNKMCLRCRKDWNLVTDIFYDHLNAPIPIVFEMLRRAVQEAVEEGWIRKSHRLAKRWLLAA